MCTPRTYVGRRGNYAPNELSWHIYRPTLVGTLARPCRNPAAALAVPASYTLHLTAPGRVSLGIPTGTGRAPVTFSSDSRPGTHRDPLRLRQGICKTRFDHDHSARGPPWTSITTVLTARTGPGLIVT